ncbi:MAG: uracil-DNA glycosylase, partial [Dehalococcoidales bacterium]|nr:uracil-DNA glycosylase [Dehalococcoidales bacterium]
MSALIELNKEIALCRQCEIAKLRTKVVPGEGAADADILFIGEAPGWHEDQQGRPFVGPAGKYLDELLASIHLKREQVYIANVIKCRPPNNREPLPVEIHNCRNW